MLACGLNHIPLQYTNLEEVVVEMLKAWELMVDILYLNQTTCNRGTCWLETFFWSELKQATKKNTSGHKHLSKTGLSEKAIEELKYLTEHFYCSGIDKARNNISIICFHHIRRMALYRLQDDNCIHQETPMAEIMYMIREDMDCLILEIRFCYVGLPFLFATYNCIRKNTDGLLVQQNALSLVL